jgi:hypothetical protein
MRSLEISGFLRVRSCGGAGTASNLRAARGDPGPTRTNLLRRLGRPFFGTPTRMLRGGPRHGVVHKKRRARRKFKKPLCRSGFFHRSLGASALENEKPLCHRGFSNRSPAPLPARLQKYLCQWGRAAVAAREVRPRFRLQALCKFLALSGSRPEQPNDDKHHG